MIAWLSLLSVLYFTPIQFFLIFSPPALLSYLFHMLQLLAFNTVIEMVVMIIFLYVIANPPSPFELFRPVFSANVKALLIAKLFHQIYILIVSLLPLVGSSLIGSGIYAEVIIVVTLEYFFIRQALNDAFEKDKLDHEQMGDDLLFAVIIANLVTFCLHFAIKSL